MSKKIDKADVNVTKVRANLEKFIKENPKKKVIPVILCLGGSFNPVHVMHHQTFLSVKKALDGKKFLVVGGYFVPTTDSYVHSKLKSYAIPLVHRNALINLTVKDCQLVENFELGIVNAFSAADFIESEVRIKCKDLLTSFHPVQCLNIIGADFAIKVPHIITDLGTVIVKRGKYNKQLDELINGNKYTLRAEIVECDDLEKTNMSSTQIRDALRDGIYLETHMHPDCISYFKQHEKTMFGIDN